jgi:hypothetical protein
LSGIDLAHPQAFSWRFPDELLDYCVSLTPEDLKEAGRLGRLQYKNFHSGKNLQEILNDPNRFCPKPNALSDQFSVESDEFASWMEQQLSIKRLLFRAAYRFLKRLRAWNFCR